VSRPDRRRRHGSNRRRIVVWALVLALVFAIGVALGEALNDNPQPGSTTTQERTITLLPESSTVTVTTP
jgi:ferric-dicitrate binding protein FerR (iron transport regulator)